ncbi:hypothetical protein TTRE_0000189701 [Trichuris trichiura]|uniref:Uncharacterized protein n=1 Tax=Trichuris trichiura TaxID=36087 RepID=A0A077YZV0_TRITR|nr:hypothetical protein TTRE_0000189701 [Trichuris trichiura]
MAKWYVSRMRDQQLYISGDKCLFCASGKCDGDLCVPDTTTEEPPCGKKPADLVPLYRLVHKSRYDTILSTNKDIGSTVASAYENKGIFGYISTTQDSSCKHLEQLMQLSASGKVDYVYVTGTEYLSYYNQKNYNFVTTLGYVVSKPDLCGANVTAHQFIRSSTWNYYTTDEAEASEILLRTGTYSTFWLIGNAFALWSAA